MPSNVEPPLSKKEIEALRMVRERLGDRLSGLDVETRKGRIYDDMMLLKFLYAREFNIQNTVDMLKKDMEFRKVHELDTILDTFPQNPYFQSLQNYIPCRRHKTDRRGIPLYCGSFSLVHARSLMGVVPKEVVQRYLLWYTEESEKEYRAALQRKGVKYDRNGGITVIEDLSPLSWDHLYEPEIRFLQEFLEIDFSHYPEMTHRVLVINAPVIFTMFWKIVRPMIDQHTLSKIEILGSQYMDKLLEEVPLENIPRIFGGKCNCEGYCLGGHGGDYKGFSEREGRKQIHPSITAEDSWKCKPVEISIPPAKIHELRVEIKESNTPLCWFFRTREYDIRFSITHEEREIELFPARRVDSQNKPCQGVLDVPFPGTVLLCWDNSYSVLRTKHLSYRVATGACHGMSVCHSLPPPATETASTSASSSSSEPKKEISSSQ